ncbi:hypothetical protein AcV5_008857 [Taiwanofungus camphoratus]|nr:hypothetical protein AcV5_008857 [Antrodia cinnamomea]
MPENRKFIFIAIYFVLPKLLLNAFLATLNARGSFRETVRDKTAGAFVSIPLSKPLGSHATTNDRSEYSQGHENQQIQIEVQTSRDMKVDPLNNIPGAREVHNTPHVNCDPELQ